VNRKTALLLLTLFPPACGFSQHSTSPAPLPPNYKTTLEDPTFKIIRVHYGPHEKVPVHDHPDTPTVYVYLNNSGPVRIIHAEDTIVRPPTHTGAFRVSPGRIERHSIENMSDLASDFLRVELLNLRLGDDTLEFRGPAPTDLSHNLSATEFSSPRLSIIRTICIDKSSCAIPASALTSVIVAFSDTSISIHGRTSTLHLGDSMPVTPQQSFKIAPTGSAPAHVLQILVPTHAIQE
jgi:hypothetical protein